MNANEKVGLEDKPARVHWLHLADLGDCHLYFFLLLRSQRGALYRQVWKHIKLPDAKSAICWRTWDVLRPGMGEQCPVCNALRAVKKHADEKVIDPMWSRSRVYINAYVLGKRKLNNHNDPVDPFIPLDKFEKGGEEPKKARLLQLPPAVCEELVMIQNGPMGSICMPDNAVVCILKRFRSGIDTKCWLTLSGSADSKGNFQPNWTPMFQSPEEMEACLGTPEHPALPDLDSIWPLPDQEGINVTHEIGMAIRTRFGVPGQPVHGAGQFTVTVQPCPEAQAPCAPTPPPPQEAPPAPTATLIPSVTPDVLDGVPPVGDGVPPAGPTPPAEPPLALAGPPTQAGPLTTPPLPPGAIAVDQSIPGLDLNRLRTETFGPLPPADGTLLNRPICFLQMGIVQEGPNKGWCDHCPFHEICKTDLSRAGTGAPKPATPTPDDHDEVPGFVPTREELLQLVRYWWRTIREIEWCDFLFDEADSSSLRARFYASRRIDRIVDLLGASTVQNVIKEVEVEFSKDKNLKYWRIFISSHEADWEAVLRQVRRESERQLGEDRDGQFKLPGRDEYREGTPRLLPSELGEDCWE